MYNVMEHNPVYLGFFKYHKFTQILPTKYAVFTQYFENPKSLKFLKLIFDVFVSQKFHKNTNNFIWLDRKKNRDKIIFSFSGHIQGQKNNFILKKESHAFLPKFGLNLAYFATKNVISAI